MNPQTLLVQVAVLCAALTLVNTSNIGADDDAKKSRRRKCRCKKYIAQINQDIDKRLEAFENKFEKYLKTSLDDLNKNNDDVHLNVISENMNETRDTLKKESLTLKRLQRSIHTQEISVETLNANFQALDTIVRNLSRIVERLEWTMRSSLEFRLTDVRTQEEAANTTPEPLYPTDCEAVYASGGMKYLGDYYIMVRPDRSPTPFKVVCKIIEGAGWTVIQRRQDGRENFSRDWEDYKHGFGRLQGEFWLGNDNIHFLTTQGDYELRVVLEDWEGGRHHAVYDRFRVSGEDQDFRLHVSGYHGDAGDSLTTYYHSHDGMAFSTYDRDNDRRLYDNCAEFYSGGWWFNDCFESHLNGMYYQYGDHDNYFVRNGIQWNTIHRYSSLKFVEMMVKPAKSPKLPNEI